MNHDNVYFVWYWLILLTINTVQVPENIETLDNDTILWSAICKPINKIILQIQ